MVSALAELALAYYRAPLRYPHLSDMSRPLPRGFEGMLAELGAALSSSRVAETAALLATEPTELQEAARFFVRHVLLDPAADCYRCLGLSPGASTEAVRKHHLLLMRMFHPDRLGTASEADLAYASRINAAYHTLRDSDARRDYDRGLSKISLRHGTGDPVAFFRPSVALPVTGPAPMLDRIAMVLQRPRVLVPLGLAVALIAAVLISQQLRVKPAVRLFTTDAERNQEIVPRYLARGSAAGAGDRMHAEAAYASERPTNRTSAMPEDERRQAGDRTAERVDLGAEAGDDSALLGSPAGGAAETSGDEGAAHTAPTENEARRSDGLARHRPGPTSPAAQRAPTSDVATLAPRGRKDQIQPEPRHSTSMAQTDRIPARAPSGAPLAPGSQLAERRQDPQPAVDPPDTNPTSTLPPSVPPVADGSRPPTPAALGQPIIARLESAYRRGDADALAALFAKGAQTNEGAGRSFIRNLYATFFARATDSRLSIRNLTWRAVQDGRLVGLGRIQVSNKYRGSRSWHHATGRIRLELAEHAAGGYRITQMLYDLD